MLLIHKAKWLTTVGNSNQNKKLLAKWLSQYLIMKQVKTIETSQDLQQKRYSGNKLWLNYDDDQFEGKNVRLFNRLRLLV